MFLFVLKKDLNRLTTTKPALVQLFFWFNVLNQCLNTMDGSIHIRTWKSLLNAFLYLWTKKKTIDG